MNAQDQHQIKCTLCSRELFSYISERVVTIPPEENLPDESEFGRSSSTPTRKEWLGTEHYPNLLLFYKIVRP